MTALAADTVTVLRCAPGRRATKLITGRPDGSVSGRRLRHRQALLGRGAPGRQHL